MSGIVYKPNKHSCNPGWTKRWHEHTEACGDGSIPVIARCLKGIAGEETGYTMAIPPAIVEEGSVWECECGRTYVAIYPYRNFFAPEYRPETWWEKRKRIRARVKVN